MIKPDYPGTFLGECKYGTIKVATGKRFPIYKDDGEHIWIPVKETRDRYYWTWDGKRWLTEAQWQRWIAVQKRLNA